MAPWVSALPLRGVLLPASPRTMRVRVIHLRRVRVMRLFGMSDSEDLMRYAIDTVAHEQRPHEEERQEYPPGAPVEYGTDALCASHSNWFITFHYRLLYTL